MTTLLKLLKLLGLVREHTVYKNAEVVPDGTIAVTTNGYVQLQSLGMDQVVASRMGGVQFQPVPEDSMVVSTGGSISVGPFVDDQIVGRRGTGVYFEAVPNDVIVIPRGANVHGEIHTDMAVVVAGTLDGSVNILGNQDLIVLEGGELKNGLASADRITVRGIMRNAAVDVDALMLPEGGRLEGNNSVRYDSIRKHDDAPLNGRFERRTGAREVYAYETRLSVAKPGNN